MLAMTMLNRRKAVSRIAGGLMLAGIPAAQAAEPWSSDEVLQPADLAKRIEAGTAPPIICVAFPVLYRQRHIKGAQFGGPGNKPEGQKVLEALAGKLSKQAEVVLYCGCCPMTQCPNIRPSYETLKRLGFQSIRVLSIPTNMHTDWVTKGYPCEPALSPQSPTA